MSSPATQADLNFSIEHPDWVALKLLLGKIDEELSQQRKHLLMKLSDWYLAIDLFRDFEDRRLYQNEPTERDREYHRVFLTQLLSQGETLALELRRHDEIDPKHIGLNLADVEATVRYLRDSFSSWFTELKDVRKEEVLKEVFGEPPAGA
jgi:hypothetical protein